MAAVLAAARPPPPLTQVMSSGLTSSTSPNSTCADWLARGYTQEPLGLRQRWGSDSNGCDRLVGGSFATLKVLQLWFAKVFFLFF